jgi:GNAT superfamily N-acetyltransferase
MDIRDLCERDIPAILALIRADHLPGQPICTLQDVQNALAGHATIDRGWWEALNTIQTIVATINDEIVGVASYGTRKQDDTEFAGCGFILWLHAREDQEVTASLISSLLSSLQQCPCVYAFWIATPLTLGVEALPVEHRPVMHQVLLTTGFTGEDDWLYMKGLPLTQQSDRGMPTEIEQIQDGWKVSLYEGHERIAEAEIGLGRDQIGVLWWIEVQEHWRGRGLGKQLLLQVRKILGDAGAHTVILYVDHDDLTERNRLPAIRLYQSQSFVVIDHLWSYKKRMSMPAHNSPPS